MPSLGATNNDGGQDGIGGHRTNHNPAQDNVTTSSSSAQNVEHDNSRRWWKFGQLQQQQQQQKEPKNDVKLTIDKHMSNEANELSIISTISTNKSQVIDNISGISGGQNGATLCHSPIVIASTSDATPAVEGSSVATQTTRGSSGRMMNKNSIHSSSSHIILENGTSPNSQLGGSRTDLANNNVNLSGGNQANGNQWILVASQTTQEMRHRMSIASDQLGYSLRQLYASASSITGDVPPSYHNIPGIVPYYRGRSSGPPPSYDDVVNPYAAPPTYQSLFGQMLEARKTSRGLVELLRRLLIISTLGCTMLIAFMILIPFTMIIVGAVYMEDCNIEHIPAFLLVGGLVWATKNIIHCYAQCAAQNSLPDPSLNEFGAATRADITSANLATDEDTTANGNGVYRGNIGSSGEQLNCNVLQQNGNNSNSNSSNNNNNSTSSTPEQGEQSLNDYQHQQFQQRQREQRFKSSIVESLLNCVLFGWFIAGCVIVFKNYEPDFENTSSPRYCHRTVYMYTFWLITSAITMFGLFITCICCLMVSSALATREHDDIS